MPVAEKKYFYKSNLSWGLWHITETLDELVELIELNDIDKSYLKKIGHDKKKKEFLAGRLLLKELLHYYEQPYKGVIKDDILKPYLVDCSYHISLSHSHEYATAVIHPENKTAIDIELIGPKLLAIAPKFLTEEEHDFCGNDVTKITLIWCVKETLYKVFHGRGLIFKENLHVTQFPTQNEGFLEAEIRTGSITWKYRMHHLIYKNYAVTFIES